MEGIESLLYAEVSQFHYALLYLIVFFKLTQLPYVLPHLKNRLILRRHQRPPLPLVPNQHRTVIIPLQNADQRQLRIQYQLMASPPIAESQGLGPAGRRQAFHMILDIEYSKQGICGYRDLSPGVD